MIATCTWIGSAAEVHDHAPSFDLPNANSADQSLAELLEQRPAVLVFYRTSW